MTLFIVVMLLIQKGIKEKREAGILLKNNNI